KTFRLDQNVTLTSSARFIIVVADAGKDIAESDENNNAMFVIPLLKHGYFTTAGTFGTGGVKESKVVGAITGYISRGTDDATHLEDLESTWTGIQLSNGGQG